MFGKKHSEETRKKISYKRIGKYHSEETKKKMSENRKGEDNSNSILTTVKVIQIKMLFKLGFKNIEISKLYDVAPNTISDIRNEIHWSNIRV
jgi:hypothetical protein